MKFVGITLGLAQIVFGYCSKLRIWFVVIVFVLVWVNWCHKSLGNWKTSKTPFESRETELCSLRYGRLCNWIRDGSGWPDWRLGTIKNNTSFCWWENNILFLFVKIAVVFVGQMWCHFSSNYMSFLLVMTVIFFAETTCHF